VKFPPNPKVRLCHPFVLPFIEPFAGILWRVALSADGADFHQHASLLKRARGVALWAAFRVAGERLI
jgi:hypothetical protein